MVRDGKGILDGSTNVTPHTWFSRQAPGISVSMLENRFISRPCNVLLIPHLKSSGNTAALGRVLQVPLATGNKLHYTEREAVIKHTHTNDTQTQTGAHTRRNTH